MPTTLSSESWSTFTDVGLNNGSLTMSMSEWSLRTIQRQRAHGAAILLGSGRGCRKGRHLLEPRVSLLSATQVREVFGRGPSLAAKPPYPAKVFVPFSTSTGT